MYVFFHAQFQMNINGGEIWCHFKMKYHFENATTNTETFAQNTI